MAQPLGLLAGIYFLYLIDRDPGPFLEVRYGFASPHIIEVKTRVGMY